jgi:hypothetical protein
MSWIRNTGCTKTAKIVCALVRQPACAEKSASFDAWTISLAQSSVKGKRHLLEVGQFGLLNLAHVPEQDFAHGIEGILPLKWFIEIYKNV